MPEPSGDTGVAACEEVASFRAAVRGYARPAVQDAVVGLRAHCVFLQRLARDLADELRELEDSAARRRSSRGAGADVADGGELSGMIEAIMGPAQVDARGMVAQADLDRTSSRAQAEQAADGVRHSAELECARMESAARARAEQMLSAAGEYAEGISATAAACESEAAAQAEQLLGEMKRAMIGAAATEQTAINTWCAEQAAALEAREADQDSWLRECQLAAQEAEQLSVLLPQEARRLAQEILEGAQEQINALVQDSARLAEFAEHQAQHRCAELREHMEAIHDGIASLAEQLPGRGPVPVSTYDWHNRRGRNRAPVNRRLQTTTPDAARAKGEH